MHHRDVWSLSLGRWGGIHVRLHIFFVLFGLLTGYLAWQLRTNDGDTELMWLALISVFILLGSVLAHELGHYFAAVRLGGHMDTIVLGPLGGLRPARVPKDPQSELLSVIAGPAITLAICIGCLMLAGILAPESARDLLRLFEPAAFDNLGATNEINLMTLIRLTCWINWWLLILNVIPAFPFDGGRALVAFLQVVRPKFTLERSVAMVATIARLVALGLFLLAFVCHDEFPSSDVPSWLALLLLAVFVFFSARVEEYQVEADEDDEELFGYDFSQGYTSLERSTTPKKPPPGPFTRWWNRYQEKRRIKQAAIESAEDRESDEILQRLHEHGMDSLSPRERSLLKRVSERYRSRNTN